MSYNVVLFTKENVVEAVPSYWYSNNQCAWPKSQNPARVIEKRTKPYSLEFDWFSARLLSKEISSLQDARFKAKLATNISDLSSAKESKESRKYRHKKENTEIEPNYTNPQFKKKNIASKSTKMIPSPPKLDSSGSENIDDSDNDKSYIPFPDSRHI